MCITSYLEVSRLSLCPIIVLRQWLRFLQENNKRFYGQISRTVCRVGGMWQFEPFFFNYNGRKAELAEAFTVVKSPPPSHQKLNCCFVVLTFWGFTTSAADVFFPLKGFRRSRQSRGWFNCIRQRFLIPDAKIILYRIIKINRAPPPRYIIHSSRGFDYFLIYFIFFVVVLISLLYYFLFLLFFFLSVCFLSLLHTKPIVCRGRLKQ